MSDRAWTIGIGDHVAFDGQAWRVTRFLTSTSVLAENLQTGKPERLMAKDVQRIETLTQGSDATAGPAGCRPDIETISEADWAEAQRRFAIIEPLLDDPDRTRTTVEAAAKRAGCHASTVFIWMRAYQASMHLAALVPKKRGRKQGLRRLDPEIEKIVEVTIGDVYLKTQKGSMQNVVDEVEERCGVAGLPAPHANTVRRRVRALDAAHVLRSRGRRDLARSLYTPIRGEFPGADYPLAVVQIDHTPGNIVIVEDRTRLPMGRAWLTLAIEVYCRMVFGWYVSMEHPNAAAVGICLYRGMMPKDRFLRELGVPGEWPVHGRPTTVHVDNAREFKGAMLKKACEDYNIQLQFRPVKTPHYGGHIERLMGTVAKQICKLPGATFESPEARKGYDSDKHSAMTLAEFEAYVIDWIVNHYHRRIHSSLGMPPAAQWGIGILGDGTKPGTGLPWTPEDPDRLRLDFLPWILRTVQPYGIVIDDVHYYHEVLNRWINAVDPEDPRGKRKRKFLIRYDPRDISRMHFYDPDAGEYFDIPYRDTTRPPASRWELREARQELRQRGAREVDEDALFETVLRLRHRVEESIAKTKAARRRLHRQSRLPKHPATPDRQPALEDAGTGASPLAASAPPPAPGAATADLDPFAMPIEPYRDRGRSE